MIAFKCFLEFFRRYGGGWWAVEMTCTCLGDFCGEAQIRKNGLTIQRINNSVGLSICDGLIETVKYI